MDSLEEEQVAGSLRFLCGSLVEVVRVRRLGSREDVLDETRLDGSLEDVLCLEVSHDAARAALLAASSVCVVETSSDISFSSV